jgi:hypothetical protein
MQQYHVVVVFSNQKLTISFRVNPTLMKMVLMCRNR